MQTIKPFIDKGFYTVPLKGKLVRDSQGKKSVPMFDKDWNVRHTETFNEREAKIGLVFTGEINDIVAIDCDNQVTYDIFKALNPSYKFEFISKGKPEGGGTIIYKNTKEVQTFKIHNEITQIDFYNEGSHAVYLPTNENETKVSWKEEDFKELPTIEEMPDTVLALLKSYQYQYLVSKRVSAEPKEETKVAAYANYLAPQVEQFVDGKEFVPSLFKILTPRDFRDLEQYVKYGYLHPDQVPDGRGSEYISKISAILGSDVSISKDLYASAIKLINELWSTPIVRSRLEGTIVRPMVQEQVKIAGKVVWQYDAHWKKRGVMFASKNGDCLEVFFDDIKAMYYLVNATRNQVRTFFRDTDLFSYVETVGVGFPARKSIKSLIPIVNTTINPSIEFGFFTQDKYKREFNLFKQTPYLNVINNPLLYKENYKKPEVTLNYLKTLIPDAQTRNYVLGFIKRKLTSFKYSPVILYFIGAHGSGKDTFVSMLETIIGEAYIARPTTKEFLEHHNGWIVDKYFIQLDEYGNQLARNTDKQEALGKIKAYTGKSVMSVRQMRIDSYSLSHSMTIIMTANTNPLVLEEGDRRAAIIETPNVLKDADWIEASGGMARVHDKVFEELMDFCYYLAVEVDALTWDDYINPLTTKAKQNLIAEKLHAAHRISYYLRNKMFDEFKDLCELHNMSALLYNGARIYDVDLNELYLDMTEGEGRTITLTKYMKDANFAKVPSTRHGQKAYYYKVAGLEEWNKPKMEVYEGGFIG